MFLWRMVSTMLYLIFQCEFATGTILEFTMHIFFENIFCATFSCIFKWIPLKWIKGARGPRGVIKTILCYEDNIMMSKLKQFRINRRIFCNYCKNLAFQVYGLNFYLVWDSWVMLEVIFMMLYFTMGNEQSGLYIAIQAYCKIPR